MSAIPSNTADSCNCDKCGAVCHRDSVDVGAGVIHGPWGCPFCSWSQDPAYDLSDGQSDIDEESGWHFDQYGSLYPGERK